MAHVIQSATVAYRTFNPDYFWPQKLRVLGVCSPERAGSARIASGLGGTETRSRHHSRRGVRDGLS